MLDSIGFSNVAMILSYVPLGPYVESLRFGSTLISAIESSFVIHVLLIGCIKDLSCI